MHFRLFRLMSVASIFVATLGFRPGGHHQPGACHADIDVANLAKLLLEGCRAKLVGGRLGCRDCGGLAAPHEAAEADARRPRVSRTLPWCRCRCPSSPPLASGILTAALAGPITAGDSPVTAV